MSEQRLAAIEGAQKETNVLLASLKEAVGRRLDDADKDIAKLDKTVRGENGNVNNPGLVVRLDRLEQSKEKSRWLTRAILAAVFGLAGIALFGCALPSGGSPPIVQAEAQAALQVVKVRHEGQRSWVGSAVPIKCDYMGDGEYMVIYLTARHVIGPGDMWVQLFEKPDYQWADEVYEVILKDRHPIYDMGLVMIRIDHMVEVLTLNLREPVPGEEIITAGYNAGLSLGMAKGLVGSRYASIRNPQWPAYQSTAYSKRGASGGAVISQGGGLLGIHVAGHSSSEHMGLFIPVVRVEQWLEISADV